MNFTELKQSIPQPIARPLRRVVRRARLSRNHRVRQHRRRDLQQALAAIRSKAPELPSETELQRLAWAWNNTAAGDVDYLLATARCARNAKGAILECGSGLTTLLLGIFATQPVLSLENHREWAEQVARELDEASLSVDLRHVPLREFDGFTWYDVAPASLPEAFTLVICDGPPLAGIAGGRVGLLHVLGERLPPGTVFLLDEHMQIAERGAIETWQRDYNLVEVLDETPVLTLRRDP